jgi:hypothetical protein
LTDRYIIGECPRCHTLIIADGRYKSKTCPKCYSRIPIPDLKTVQTAHDSREARTILSKMKAVRGGLDQT